MSLCAALERSRRAGADPLHDGSEGVANSDQIVGVHLILAGGDGRSLMPPKGYTIKASRRLRAIPWPACRLKVEAELEARRFCRPAEGGNCCRPRRATRARAGSHSCEKQAVAITQDAATRLEGGRSGYPRVKLSQGGRFRPGGDMAGDGPRRFSLSH
jgi:hypothetical protein